MVYVIDTRPDATGAQWLVSSEDGWHVVPAAEGDPLRRVGVVTWICRKVA